MGPKEEKEVLDGEIDDFLKILMNEQKELFSEKINDTFPFSCGDGFLDDPFSPITNSGETSPANSFSSPNSPVAVDAHGKNLMVTHAAAIPHNNDAASQQNEGAYKYDPRPLGRKKRRNLVPDEKKNVDYWERRKRNNQAARRSREERRIKELQTFHSMKILQNENLSLKHTIHMMMRNQQQLQGEVIMLKQLLDQSFKQ